MSEDNKKNKFEGETFNQIIRESMHKGSDVYSVTQLLENFDEKQKEEVLNTVKGLAGIVDRIKYLAARVEEQEQEKSDG
tara:strand:+ start:398 stop:634 length:237 start_codon:yes stop_codon:yes gene_type:complete